MAHQDLSNHRKNYNKQELLEAYCPDSPVVLFDQWFKTADVDASIEEANAMTLSTIGGDGFPKSRVVLLKKYTEQGFVFFTNYNSEKGIAIAQNPKVVLSFFWPSLERQIIIKGLAERIPMIQSDEYFNSRPQGSKLGAWASNQSQVISSREVLESNLIDFQTKFQDQQIPRPAHWGGVIVKPSSIEFWQGRPNRMHDRLRYCKEQEFLWKLERLAP